MGRPDPRRPSILKAVCGLTNAIGGYLILGAERGDTGWTLPGLAFPQPEPATWITSVLDGGLEPSPVVDVRALERPEGRHAAVVRVPPIAVPPAITVDGTVYRRVSGQTLPVTNQLVLTELIESGRAARQQAEDKALRAGQHALGEETNRESVDNVFALSLCPVEGPDDRAAVLFSPQFVEGLQDVVNDHFSHGPFRYRIGVEIQQSNVRALPASRELEVGRMLVAFWDGSVAAVFAELVEDPPSTSELSEHVETAWRAAAQVASAIGGRGETHVALLVNQEHPATQSRRRRGIAPSPIRRWTSSVQPGEEDIARVQRELLRALGEGKLEPPIG